MENVNCRNQPASPWVFTLLQLFIKKLKHMEKMWKCSNCTYNDNYSMCYRLNVPPQDMWNNPLCDGIWRWHFQEAVWSGKWRLHECGVSESSLLLQPRKDKGRRQHLRARKMACQTPSMPAPLSWAIQSPELREVTKSMVSLLQQSRQILCIVFHRRMH